MTNLELIERIKDLEKKLKDATEIINAQMVGMMALKGEIERLAPKPDKNAITEETFN